MKELKTSKKVKLIECTLHKFLKDWGFSAYISLNNSSMVVLYTDAYDSVTININLDLITFTSKEELKKTVLYRVREAIYYKIGNMRCTIAQLKEIALDIDLDEGLKSNIKCKNPPVLACGGCGKDLICVKCNNINTEKKENGKIKN